LGRDEKGLVTIQRELIESAADQALALLSNADLRRDTVEHNFKIGKKHYSMNALNIYLEGLMNSFHSI
jgi:hypothetical protein